MKHGEDTNRSTHQVFKRDGRVGEKKRALVTEVFRRGGFNYGGTLVKNSSWLEIRKEKKKNRRQEADRFCWVSINGGL